MSRTEYMRELDALLHGISKEEREEARAIEGTNTMQGCSSCFFSQLRRMNGRRNEKLMMILGTGTGLP